jgi:hypothetical protein
LNRTISNKTQSFLIVLNFNDYPDKRQLARYAPQDIDIKGTL